MRRLTKENIEELVRRIEAFLEAHELLSDVCIYFNNKRRAWIWRYMEDKCVVTEKDNVNPLDYFEYVNTEHILSMSFEGALYNVLNGYESVTLIDEFQNIFEEFDLYYELGDAWNLSCYPTDDDMEIEFTDYSASVKPEPEFIYMHSKDAPSELRNIMLAWYKLSEMVGDIGSCVIGAGFKFEWNGKEYFMASCSPWQGSISWERHTDTIKTMLENIGATNIHYSYGRMD